MSTEDPGVPETPEPSEAVPAVPAEASSDTPAHTQPGETGLRKKGGRSSKYSDTEIEQGLVALALYSGNRRRAHEALKRQGLSIPETTLHRWGDSQHSDWYARVQLKVMPRVREYAAEKHFELADLEGEAARKLLTRLVDEYEKIPAHALPGSIKSLDIGAAVNRDKAAMLRGENPERPAAMRSAAEIVRALQAKNFDPRRLTVTQTNTVEVAEDPRPDAIEGTATEQ